MRRPLMLLSGVAALSLAAITVPVAGADAAVFAPTASLPGAVSIVHTSQGRYWVAQSTGVLTELASTGAPTGTTVSLPATIVPRQLAVDTQGEVWVTASKDIYHFNAASPATPTKVDTTSHCGTDAVRPFNTSVVFTEDDSGCYRLGVVDGTGLHDTLALPGVSYKLAVASGKVFVALYGKGTIARYGLSGSTFTYEATATVSDAPAAIVVSGSTVYAPLFLGTKIAHLSVGFASGAAEETTLPAGVSAPSVSDALVTPDGRLAISYSDINATTPHGGVLVVSTDGTGGVSAPLPGGGTALSLAYGPHPYDLAVVDSGTGDHANARALFLDDYAPTAGAVSASALAPQSVVLSSVIDPGGDVTAINVELGASTSYGTTVAGAAISGVGPRAVGVAVTGLNPRTIYHARIVATNARGSSSTPDFSFMTPGFPPAKGTFVVARKLVTRNGHKGMVFTQLQVKGVVAGETVTVTCQGGSAQHCFTKKVIKVSKPGTVTVKSLYNKFLGRGAVVAVKVSGLNVTARIDKLPRATSTGKLPKPVVSCVDTTGKTVKC